MMIEKKVIVLQWKKSKLKASKARHKEVKSTMDVQTPLNRQEIEDIVRKADSGEHVDIPDGGLPLTVEHQEKTLQWLRMLVKKYENRDDSPFGWREINAIQNPHKIMFDGVHNDALYGQPPMNIPYYTVYCNNGHNSFSFDVNRKGKISIVG